MARVLSVTAGTEEVVLTLWCTVCQKTRATGRGRTREQAYDAAAATARRCLWRLRGRSEQVCPNCTSSAPGSS